MADNISENKGLQRLLDKICTIAREMGNHSDPELRIDYEFEGFSHMYDDGTICINWRSFEEEVYSTLEDPSEFPSGVFVKHLGKIVLSKGEDSTTCEVYEHGDWESHVDTLYEECISLRVPEDPNLPF